MPKLRRAQEQVPAPEPQITAAPAQADPIALVYDASRNPNDKCVLGVPNADMALSQLEALRPDIRWAVCAQRFFIAAPGVFDNPA